VVDRAVQNASDDNGTGAPRTIIVDLSSFNAFSSASLITLDAATNITTGPAAQAVTPASRMTITLPGYGSAFLTLTP
jgi:hypothetical protein